MRSHLSGVGGLLLAASSLLGLPAAATAAGQSPPAEKPAAGDEVTALRRELASLRDEYTSRIAALESRLSALEGDRTVPPAAEPSPAPPPPEAAAPAAPPVYGGGAASSKVFNPDIAAIGNFVGAAGKSPGGGEPSLSMQESELAFQAVVDPYARADFFVTIGPEEVALEEGYITFPTLPLGLLAKVGKFRDAFGKVNGMHAHVLPFVDRPLFTKNLLGGEDGLADSGISVARLIPNRLMFLEATAQVYQGSSEVFKAPTRGDLAYVGHLRGYRDLGESTNLDLGGSFAYGHNGVTDDTTTRIWGIDATLRWRPLRRAIYTHLLVGGELVWSRRRTSAVRAGSQSAATATATTSSRGAGWPGALRQLRTRRRRGVRDKGGSFILTYWPSEFSRCAASIGVRRSATPTSRRTSSCSSSCSRSARTAPIRSDEVCMRLLSIVTLAALGALAAHPPAPPSTSWRAPRTSPTSPARWAATRSRSSRSPAATRIRTSSRPSPASS